MIILKETNKQKKTTKLSPRKRRGGTQVADGRSSQANAATSRWLCDRHSTGKTTRSHIRQSFDCKRNPAAREESRAVVWWGEAAICWSTGGVASQGIEGGGKGGKRMLVERRRCPRLSLPQKNTHIIVMLSDLWSITVTFNVALSQRHAHTHFYEDTSHTAPSCLTTQYGHATVWRWGQAWGPEWRRQAGITNRAQMMTMGVSSHSAALM